LNLRPLGYEFNSWLWMDSVIAKYQSHTVSMYWIVSIVPGSPVSNLLAFLRPSPPRLIPLRRRPERGPSQSSYAKFPRPPSSGQVRVFSETRTSPQAVAAHLLARQDDRLHHSHTIYYLPILGTCVDHRLPRPRPDRTRRGCDQAYSSGFSTSADSRQMRAPHRRPGYGSNLSLLNKAHLDLRYSRLSAMQRFGG
jgi:hypothetical protein